MTVSRARHARTAVAGRAAGRVRASAGRRPLGSADVDAYIARFPPKLRAILGKIRAAIRKAPYSRASRLRVRQESAKSG